MPAKRTPNPSQDRRDLGEGTRLIVNGGHDCAGGAFAAGAAGENKMILEIRQGFPNGSPKIIGHAVDPAPSSPANAA